MSETNLEQTTVAADPPVAETAGSPPKAEAPVEEQAHVDQRGQQVVPLAKLLQTRDEAKATKAELEALKAEAQQYKQFAEQWGPYAQIIAQRPELLQQLTGQGKAEPAPQYDPEAEGIAREFDLYTPQGQPDLARAQRFLERMDKRLEARVGQAIRPVQEATLSTRAQALRAEAHAYMRQTGYAKPEKFDQVASVIAKSEGGQAMLADENVVRLLMVISKGLSDTPVTPERVAQAFGDPMVTEAAGRRAGPPSLSDMESRVAAQRGLSQEKWRQLSDTSRTELE